MVVKAEAAAALLGSQGAGDTGAGTMLLKSAGGHVATLGGSSTPAFMRHMFGGDPPPPPPPPPRLPSAGRGSLESVGSSRPDSLESACSPGGGAYESSVRQSCGSVCEDDLLDESSGGGGAGGGSSAHAPGRNAAGQRNPSKVPKERRGGDLSLMGIETLSKELYKLSADMERDIGKVYRKYERLERQIRAERDRKMALAAPHAPHGTNSTAGS